MLLGVLGPLEVHGTPAAGPPRDRAVLSVLVVRRGSIVPADVIADALWNSTPPRTWPKVVQGSVVRLRKVLGVDVVTSVHGGYRLDLARGEVDTDLFDDRIASARQLQASADFARAFIEFGNALRMWRGTPFPDALDWRPGNDESQRLEELARMAEEERLACGVATGRARDLVADARALVESHPERERRWIVLATALYAAGRQVEAIDVVREAAGRLRDFYGLDPGPELGELEGSLLRQDGSLPRALVTPMASPDCPYPGLLAYREADAERFAGRSDDVEACLHRLEDQPVLVVAGASGSGKSSLVHAGLVPALRRRGLKVVDDRDDSHPDAVWVIDQFEELFPDPGSAAASDALDGAAVWASTGKVVLVIRSDRLEDIARAPRFASLAAGGIHLVGPLVGDALRQAIEHPAQRAGLLLESGLVDVLVADVTGEPGGLPLLSHALRATWEAGDRDLLTIAGYRATGGVHEALSRTAESVWCELSEEDRSAARRLLLRLVTRTDSGSPVAMLLSRAALADRRDLSPALDRLAAARLVTADGEVVTVAHAMLASAWPRLSGWLDDASEERHRQDHLRVSAGGWESSGKARADLYRGRRLAEAVEWRASERPVLEPLESSFLDASAAHHRSGRRRLAMMVGLVATVALIAAGLALLHRASPAIAGVADGGEWLVYTRSDNTGFPNLFLARPDGSDERPLMARRLTDGAEIHKADWSPDGRQLAFEVLETGPGTPHASVWTVDADGSSAKVVAQCIGDPCRQFSEPVFSPDGTKLAMVRFDLYSDHSCCTSHLEVLDLVTGERRVAFEVVERPDVLTYDVVYTPTWSPDGSELAFSLERLALQSPYAFVNSQIAVVSALRSAPQKPRLLTDPALNAWHPDWHPVDDRIVFSTNDPFVFPTGAASDVYEVREDGSGLRQLTDSTRDGLDRYLEPSWSPDGTQITLSIGRKGSGDSIARKEVALLPAEGGIPAGVRGIRGNEVRLRPTQPH